MPPGSFDTVIATDVIEHLHDPYEFLRSSARILKEDGKLIVGVPFLYWVHEAPHDYFRYTRYALEKMTSDSGLQLVELYPFGGPLEVLFDLVAKIAGSKMRATGIVNFFASWILSIPAIRNASGSKADKVPLGYILVAEKPKLADGAREMI